MPASNMTGIRHWRFTVGVNIVSLSDTDFWIEYVARRVETGAELGLIVHAVWERADLAVAQGRARRNYIEERLREIKWEFTGKTGLLEIDFGEVEAKSFADVTLVDVSVAEEKFNDSMEYTLEFRYPLNGAAGIDIARTVIFDGKTVNADNFLVEYNRDDRTVFKPVFRSAPIRVNAGPALKTIEIFALKEAITGGNPLIIRQNAEAAVKDWTFNKLGESGALTIDGVGQGTCHLASVNVSTLALPDAAIYSLGFLTGYGT